MSQSPSMLAVETVPATPEAVAGLAGAWDELLAGSPTATPFQSREWIETVLLTGRGRGRLILVREGRDLLGLYPVRVTSGAWRVARPLGVGPSDYLHPLARGGYEGAAFAEIAGALRSLPADLLDLHQIRSSLGFDPGGESGEAARCLVVDLPPTFAAYRGTLSKSLRYDVGRMDRIAGARIERADAGTLERHLGIFFDLHRERWRSRGLPGAFGARAERFQRAWTARAMGRGWLALSTLWHDGAPAGAIYTMRLGAVRYFYQAGMAPGAKAISPGTLLIAGAIREAIEEGQGQFDMMRGAEGYKRRWKPTREEINERRLVPLNAHRGEAAAAFARRAGRVESLLRERFEGGTLLRPGGKGGGTPDAGGRKGE